MNRHHTCPNSESPYRRAGRVLDQLTLAGVAMAEVAEHLGNAKDLMETSLEYPDSEPVGDLIGSAHVLTRAMHAEWQAWLDRTEQAKPS